MGLPLQLLASILLTSVCARGWPYHEIVGVGQSAAPVFVAPVYGVAPAVSLFPVEPALKETSTIVAGPVTGTTIVEGSSSGPVTIVTPGTSSDLPKNATPSSEVFTDGPTVSEDTVLIRGASAGPVTLIAPSVPDTAPSPSAETKKEAVAMSAEATVAIEDAKESSTTEASTNATVIRETIGVASAKAVIGPSTGPIVIAGPTAPPFPFPTAVPVTTTSPVSLDPATDVNATDTATAEAETGGSDIDAGTTESIGIASTPSSPSPGENSTVNSITSSAGEAALGEQDARTHPSAVVSGPSVAISASSLLLEQFPYTL